MSAIIGHKTFWTWWRRATCQRLGQETNQLPSTYNVTHLTDPSLLLLRYRKHCLVTPYAQQHNTGMYHKVDAHVKTLVTWSGYIQWKGRLEGLVMFPVIYSFSAVKSNTAGLTVTGWTGRPRRPWAVLGIELPDGCKPLGLVRPAQEDTVNAIKWTHAREEMCNIPSRRNSLLNDA
jgi:hypothetical protein